MAPLTSPLGAVEQSTTTREDTASYPPLINDLGILNYSPNCRCAHDIFPPHAGPSAAYGPEAMGWMDGQAQMMHRPPGDPAFHQGYAHYPPAEYYGHHL
ncbi:hypothetical protein DMENIID0001_088630 [Sergentomyia squamirostris]